MKFLLPTLLLVLLHCTCGRAQANRVKPRIDKSRNTVVATGGLNLRSEPGVHAKIVGKLPFGTEVEILDEQLFSPDSVNQFYEWLQPYGWAKVRADRDTGYLYDAYLYYTSPAAQLYPEGELPEGTNSKYQLVTNGVNAVGGYDVFDFKWYGLYVETYRFNLQFIKGTFRYFPGEIEEGLNMVANTEKQPEFFIGSTKNFPTGFRAGRVINPDCTEEQHRYASEETCAKNGISIEPAEGGSWASANEFTLKVGDVTQHLNPGGRARTARYLEAVGDFDGDGKTDFIISFDTAGWDMTVTYALFLSSEARPGELVRPVAVQYSYRGC